MDFITTWAIKIAEEAAPNEVDLAPLMAEAFLKGGKDREELFYRPQGTIPGAFGPGEIIAVFPVILQAILTAAPLLYTVLSSGAISNLLSAVTVILSLRDSKRQEQQVASLPDQPYAPLKETMLTISTVLRSEGIPVDQADKITYHVILALLSDPGNAFPFVQKVAGGI